MRVNEWVVCVCLGFLCMYEGVFVYLCKLECWPLCVCMCAFVCRCVLVCVGIYLVGKW